MAKKVLGLDISTTTIGWCTMTHDGFSLEMGYIPLGKLENLYQKAAEFRVALKEIISANDITDVFIEEDLQRFRKGFSSAKVIRKLSRFNGMASLIVYDELDMEPQLINVNTARKLIGCTYNKKDKSKTTKEKVFEWIIKELPDEFWPTKVISRGPRKGMVVKIVECGDMADAYVMAKAGLKTISS